MNSITPVSIWARAAAVPYAPSKGWAETGQPMPGLSAKDYIELATNGEPILQSKLVSLVGELGKSVVIVPHADFRDEFERGPDRFRPWFNGYCQRHGLNTNADAMIVTGVKDLKSAERKSQFNTEMIDMHKDYLRGMIVLLQSPLRKIRMDMGPLMEMTGVIEDMAVAHNNLYAIPKNETFCRAHKGALKQIAMDDFEIIASVKTQREDQMDIDKLTRQFMGFNRDVLKNQSKWWEGCSSFFNNSPDGKSGNKNSRKFYARADALTELGKALYDNFYARNGYNELLAPSVREKHTPPDVTELSHRIKATTGLFGASHSDRLIDNILRSGVLPPQLVGGRHGLHLTHH